VIVIVVGAGINGVTAAIELTRRRHKVVLVDPGPLPHPLAASTDISKAVRAAYGADEDYTALAERSMEVWREWNAQFAAELYHEVGFLFLRRQAMRRGGFEFESFNLLQKRGHQLERMSPTRLRQRFPAWNAECYEDGFFEASAGYVESGRIVAELVNAFVAGLTPATRKSYLYSLECFRKWIGCADLHDLASILCKLCT